MPIKRFCGEGKNTRYEIAISGKTQLQIFYYWIQFDVHDATEL